MLGYTNGDTNFVDIVNNGDKLQVYGYSPETKFVWWFAAGARMCAMVDDALAGLVLINPSVVLLKEERAVVRQDYKQLGGRVMLVSGGASGHEPYPAGYVGPGMLTAAVVGDVSVAPPPLMIVRVVRRLVQNQKEGALLIACNKSGDRLSFAIAARQLNAEGVQVKLVETGEMSGAVLIFKLAGAMVERGTSLDELFSMCSRVVVGLVTIIANPDVSVQSQSFSDVCSEDDDENLEIHDGKETYEASVAVLTKVIVAVHKQLTYLPSPSSQGCQITLLVNNMGQMSKLEEQAFAVKTTKQFLSHGYEVKRLYCGSFTTSSKVKGFSISVIKILCADMVDLLDAPTSASAWPRTPCRACWKDGVASDRLAWQDEVSSDWLMAPREGTLDQIEGEVNAQATGISNSKVLQVVLCATCSVVACEGQLNLLDCKDGDCGTTLKRGAEAVAKAIQAQQINCESPSALLAGLSYICGNAMGGASGAMYCVLFAAAAQRPFIVEKVYQSALHMLGSQFASIPAHREHPATRGAAARSGLASVTPVNRAQPVNVPHLSADQVSLNRWPWSTGPLFQELSESSSWTTGNGAAALKAGTEAIVRYGGVKVGSNTMLDSLAAAATAVDECTRSSPGDGVTAARRAAEAAELAAIRTGGHGELRHYPDPGAHAIGIWLRAVCEGLQQIYKAGR
ncbi:hypothetical protein PR048_025049 [Dryococelus australis]|uniref:Triokinase/FMN cyclase n=1 Tax=Dryococelus australis TaxID=614101 RepID=A0ABQ9GQB8_9NEOP|nr:hypothetical protein PR048_025049 [Dryococelus australis]